MPFNGLKRGCCGLRMKFEAFEQIFSNDEYNSMVIFFCVFLLFDFDFNKAKKQAEKKLYTSLRQCNNHGMGPGANGFFLDERNHDQK